MRKRDYTQTHTQNIRKHLTSISVGMYELCTMYGVTIWCALDMQSKCVNCIRLHSAHMYYKANEYATAATNKLFAIFFWKCILQKGWRFLSLLFAPSLSPFLLPFLFLSQKNINEYSFGPKLASSILARVNVNEKKKTRSNRKSVYLCTAHTLSWIYWQINRNKWHTIHISCDSNFYFFSSFVCVFRYSLAVTLLLL